MTKKRKVDQRQPSKGNAIADVAQPSLRGSTQLTLKAGEAVALTGPASVRVEMGTAWLAGKVMVAGASLCVDSDAKYGGPLHIEALPDQQQVPLATTGVVKLTLASRHGSAAAEKEPEGLSYKMQMLSSAQMALRRYSQPWLQAAEDVVSAVRQGGCPAVAVVGSKGVGKSTLSRLLVNSLLEATPVVAYLDTDCGQSEFTVPGLVSLTLLDKPVFGPPHLHMQQPTRSHFIGDLSPQGNPLHYLASVRSLYDWYWNHCGSKQQGSTVKPPLVVNTHGWIKGLGFEVLAQVLESLSPSHVMQLTTPNPNNNLPPDKWWLPEGLPPQQGDPLLYQLPSVGALQQDMGVDPSGAAFGWALRQPPAEQRALQWLAFARQCMGQPSSPCSWDLPAFAAAADALAAHPPYKVPLSHFQVAFHHARIADAQVLQALNGAVVAFTKSAEKPQAGGEGVDQAAVATAPSVCLGIGIVRSVDPAKQLLYILTPAAPLHELQQATRLEVGNLDLPLALLQTANFMSPYISVWSITADGTGAGAMKARNTLLRQRLKPSG